MKHQTINISLQTIVQTVLFLISMYLLFLIKEIILAIFLAVILMSAFNPSVSWLKKNGVPRIFGIIVLYVIVFGFLGSLFTVILPPLGREVSGLVRSLQIPNVPPGLTQMNWSVENISDLIQRFGSSLNSVFGILSSTFNGFVFLITTIVMSIYMLIDRENITSKIFWDKEQARFRKFADELLDKVEIQLGGWVRGQLILMLIVGVITYIILSLLGVPYALPLAVLAGFMEILPNLGPTIASIPAIIIALLLVNPTIAGAVALSYILIQQFENHLLVPRIMKAAVDVDPLVSIILILSGVKIGGILGALLAIPIFITLRSAFFQYLEYKKLHKIG